MQKANNVVHLVPGKRKHTRKCECDACLKRKIREYRDRLTAMRHPAYPTSLDQTIPVRGHFRRSSNHLNKSPKLKELVQQIVLEFIKAAQ